jgi:hypothetical protein
VEIAFNGNKTIDRVVVYSVQDNFQSPVEPTDAMTFTQYGVQDFTVEGRGSGGWVTLGTVSNNNLVKRTVSFGAMTVDRIRVTITRSVSQWSLLTEVEAWGVAEGVAAAPTSMVLASSTNPVLVGQMVDLTATVSGNGPTGGVNFADSGSAIAGCSGIALNQSGTAVCSTNSLTAGTHSIVAYYSGDATNAASNSPALTQTVSIVPSSTNVALSSAGAVATASSTYQAGYPVSAINNNERKGAVWGSGGGWADGTLNIWPDSVEIAFNGNKTIDRVVVYSVQDNFQSPVEPTDEMTFTRYGVQDFTVEGRASGGWVTLGTVSNNNLVKRTVSFGAMTVDRIRVTITRSLSQWSLLTEVEAWGLAEGAGAAPTSTVLASSTNPVLLGQTVDLTATVSGNGPTGGVNFTDSGSTIAGCSGIALNQSGTAVCSTNSLTAGTHNIAAQYGGDVANAGSSSSALIQMVSTVPGSTNVALASAGALATASSTYQSGYPVSAINNNERKGAVWGSNGGWADGTPGTFPDWVQIAFNGNKTIDRVVVYSVQDNYNSPVEPGDSLTFHDWGATAFNVEGWNGSGWTLLGSVSGNNLVKRTVTFAPFTTDRIRITVLAAANVWSLITEVEAWDVAEPAQQSALATLAAAMPVGTWAELTTGDIGSVIARPGTSLSMIPYTGAMPWDPVHRQIHIVGSDHINYDGLPAYYNRYDDDSNDWSIVLRTPLGSEGYQHTAVDSEGNVYLLSLPTSAIYKWNGSDFVHFATLPSNTSNEIGMAMVHWSGPGFGGKGALVVYHGGLGALLMLTLDTGAWASLNSAISYTGYYQGTAAYSAKKNVMVYGGGNPFQAGASKEIWRLNADRSKTRMPDAPLPVGINHGMVPIPESRSGNFLFLGFGQLWELNPDGAGTWTLQTGTRVPPAGLVDPSTNSLAALVPVDVSTYGVTLWIDAIYSRNPVAKVRLYKHAP